MTYAQQSFLGYFYENYYQLFFIKALVEQPVYIFGSCETEDNFVPYDFASIVFGYFDFASFDFCSFDLAQIWYLIEDFDRRFPMIFLILNLVLF